MYHNDLLYKNVLRDGRRLYLVDFERCGAALTDADTDGILSRFRPNMTSFVSVLCWMVRSRNMER